jgi:hypothetical protein
MVYKIHMVMAIIKIMKGVCHAEDKDICSSVELLEKKKEKTQIKW